MYCCNEKDKILYNRPLNNGRNNSQEQCQTCGYSSSGNHVQVYKTIPLGSEQRTDENGRQVIYIRIGTTATNPDKPNCTTDDGKECTNENCECSSPNSDQDVAKADEDKDVTKADEDLDVTKADEVKDAATKQEQTNPDEPKKETNPSWWKCGKDGCPCQKMITDPPTEAEAVATFEISENCNFCTVPGENGEKIKIPCHYCFTDVDENCGANQCGGTMRMNIQSGRTHCCGRKLNKYSMNNRLCCGSYSGGWNKVSPLRGYEGACHGQQQSSQNSQYQCVNIFAKQCGCECHRKT